MGDLLMRADEGIQHLKVLVRSINSDSTRLDGQLQALNSLKKVSIHRVPVEIIRQCETCVTAVFLSLLELGKSVQPVKTGSPPEGWRELRQQVAIEAAEHSPAKEALLDALDILDSHICLDLRHVASLIVILGNLDGKVIYSNSFDVFRALSNPHSNETVIRFHPQTESNAHPPVDEAMRVVSPWGWSCVELLSAALDEIEALVAHN